ncbi:MAG: phosphoglucosamine mutase [Candidatus Aminicenantes bacterium]|nr:phosphoglucosamine mutase [Candidatus Aminicenantes bacterium]
MDRLFGTDGIRATAGSYPLDSDSVFTLGKGLISLLKKNNMPPLVLIGRDTRESGEWLEQALTQGIRTAKGNVTSCGVIPTSAVSYLTKKHGFSAGIVISASHNPYQDNGIKIFSSTGMKISEDWEKELEKSLKSSPEKTTRSRHDISPVFQFRKDYIEFLKNSFSASLPDPPPGIVLDCANGSAYEIAPLVFRELGFPVSAISTSPDGKNINDGCGALHPGRLARAVLDKKAAMGIAFDGDADRAIWVDEKGRILNGDHTLFVLSKFMQHKNLLRSSCVVATTMSNIGLELALEKMGIKMARAPVGDKYVLENMIRLKSNLGGEQSGHTILLDTCPTGDGILTGLKILEAMLSQNIPLSRLVEGFRQYPQVLLNIPVTQKKPFETFPDFQTTREQIQNRLGATGRLNVRYSGTELLARIMVEGKDETEIEGYARQIADIIKKNSGLP